MKEKIFLHLWISFLSLFVLNLFSQQFSTARFFPLSNSPRKVESMNPAWRLCKDKDSILKNEAWKVDFNDQQWGVVSLPNGLEYLPEEASGGINYRGEAWYRKHFTLDNSYQDKRILLYFEAIMGKSKIWVNGQLVSEHFGGFLPIPIDITNAVKINQENVIAVWTDNSNDPNYPPGKPQAVLDFAYFGGIYRDCWLISTDKLLYITDANQTDKVADGGLFVFYPEICDKIAKIGIRLNLQNDNSKIAEGVISYELIDQQGIHISNSKEKYLLDKNSNATFSTSVEVNNPMLWSPDFPHLYHLNIRILNKKGNIIDGYTKKIGIRSIAFNPQQGFILNGKPFPRKLIGANRHQDYAVVGNALSNSLHWRDAYKLKQAGMDIIRNAHYPQDPAFMDACEALGLFVIENTPGWQFWNDTPIFKQRVYQDIRNIVRRDRNSPSVIMWEPILNETWYPNDFAKTVHNIIKQEYPSGNYTVSDNIAKGHEYFDIMYAHPMNIFLEEHNKEEKKDTTKVRFTREWGDNVDDWNSHNSPSRVSRQWGEIPMLIQAIHYANPPYPFTSYDRLYRTPAIHIGGTLWHSFDHQRGYHPDPFYGGIMDAFRRPNYAYYMFQSQSDQVAPMVFIANEMTPFSPEDVTVKSNCDEVRLYTKVGDSIRIYHHKPNNKMSEGMPYPIITFKKAWNVMKDKYFARNQMHDSSYIKAEGLRNGKVVATDIRYPSRRPAALRLVIDTATITPNGSDLVLVVAQIIDDKGVVKRLNNGIVKFEIEGEGMLIGNDQIMANPKPIVWGEAPVLVQTTTRAGNIKVKASMLFEGDHTPALSTIQFQSSPAEMKMIYSETENQLSGKSNVMNMNTQQISNTYRKQMIKSIKEVEQQQEDFGEKQQEK